MRVIVAAAFLLSLASLAQAQTPLTGTTGPQTTAPLPAAPPAATRTPRRTLQQRFDAANTSHDGHLTLAQAQSGMPAVARNFAAIDSDNKGYVTLEQIRAYARARRAARGTSTP